jgi:hypothetical protein
MFLLSKAHWAAGGGGDEVCRFLRDECGVDFTARNHLGSTPLSKVKEARPTHINTLLNSKVVLAAALSLGRTHTLSVAAFNV